MEHLACFVGGMFGLAAKNDEDKTLKKRWMHLAEVQI